MRKQILLLAFISSIFIVSTLLFAKGFLLSRNVLDKQSTCNDFVAKGSSSSGNSEACFMEGSPPFNRLIILIIDALRYDFVAPQGDGIRDKHFHNRMSTILMKLSAEPNNSRLYKFLADPPTTTMQRIKGLTTGSLPTFVDAGSNFGSEAIAEDNWVSQAARLGWPLVFAGDDTWDDLFPGHFTRNFSYPSFNVKDLDSVDNGVIAHLYPELRAAAAAAGAWRVLIGHFLGVDHAGHRYGPAHPEMARKLDQMNTVIGDVMDSLDNETLLVVLGDHGMTSSGDHGGDSDSELDAALFLYSKQKRFAKTDASTGENLAPAVRQIDLVPTLSLAMGMPIPYSNIGTVIGDVFGDTYVDALAVNALQVRRFIKSYANTSSDFSPTQLETLEEKFQNGYNQYLESSDGEREEAERLLREYLRSARGMCAEVWARFDLATMGVALGLGLVGLVGGATIAFVGTASSVCAHWCRAPPYLACFSCAALLTVASPALTGQPLADLSRSAVFWGCLGVAFTAPCLINTCLALKRIMQTSNSGNYVKPLISSPFISLVLFAVSCLSLHSNSFVVWEDSKNVYFIQTYLILTTVEKLSGSSLGNLANGHKKGSLLSKGSLIKLSLKNSTLQHVVMTAGVAVLARLMACVRKCREEQLGPGDSCVPSPLLTPLHGIMESEFRSMKYILAVLSLSAPVLVLRFWLRHCGNLNGWSPTVLAVRYLHPAIVVCISLHWATQCVPDTNMISRTDVFAQTAYAGVLLAVVLWLCDPLCLFTVLRGGGRRAGGVGGCQVPMYGSEPTPAVIGTLFRQLKSSLDSPQPDAGDVPLVYGLGTGYSGSLLALGGGLYLLVATLTGDGGVTTLAAFVAAAVFLARVSSVISVGQHEREVPLSAVVCFHELSRVGFHATGHHYDIPSTPFNAAFHGFSGDHSTKILPAAMVLTNLYGAFLLSVALLPLLLLWRWRSLEVSRGELGLIDAESDSSISLCWLRLAAKYLFVRATLLLSTMSCALLLRRHLMVWKIFAPRFIFEGVGFIMSCIFLVVVSCVLFRIDAGVQKFVKSQKD